MKKSSPIVFAALALSIAMMPACLNKKADDEEGLNHSEAKEGVDETVSSNSAALTVDGVVEISTHFTIGKAVDEAAKELHDWAVSQIPCSTASLSGGTVTIDFGVLGDNCVYNGKTWAGIAKITLESVAENNVVVKHQWTDLTNGEALVNGTATVTWKLKDGERRVEHEINWVYKNKTWTGWGDRAQTRLDDTVCPADPKKLSAGIKVAGERGWKTAAGDWTLTIDNVEACWQDAVPQSGSYTLLTPNEKSLSLSFGRVDSDTIKVTVGFGKHSFSFNVTTVGSVSDA